MRVHAAPLKPAIENGVMIHHTVTSGTAASVDICYDGYSSLPGPLCHGVIDKRATCTWSATAAPTTPAPVTATSCAR